MVLLSDLTFVILFLRYAGEIGLFLIVLHWYSRFWSGIWFGKIKGQIKGVVVEVMKLLGVHMDSNKWSWGICVHAPKSWRFYPTGRFYPNGLLFFISFSVLRNASIIGKLCWSYHHGFSSLLLELKKEAQCHRICFQRISV